MSSMKQMIPLYENNGKFWLINEIIFDIAIKLISLFFTKVDYTRGIDQTKIINGSFYLIYLNKRSGENYKLINDHISSGF